MKISKIISLVVFVIITLAAAYAQGIKKYTIKVRKPKAKGIEIATDIPLGQAPVIRSSELKLFKGFMLPVELVYNKVVRKNGKIIKVENGQLVTKNNKQYIYCNKLGNLKVYVTDKNTNKPVAYQLPVRTEPVIFSGKTPEGTSIDGVSLIALPFRFKAKNGNTNFSFNVKITRFTISYNLNNKITTYTFTGDKIPIPHRKEFDSLPPGTKVTVSEIYFNYFNTETILKKNATFTIEELRW
jgi:hypothetical protein